MSEAAFPLLGAAFVFVVVLPACALLVKLALVALERGRAGGPLELRYLLLTGSSALPLAWLVSASLHQLEPGKSVLACLFEHADATLCAEPAAFAFVLGASTLALSLGASRRRRAARPARSEAARALLARLARVVASEPGLAPLAGRMVVTDEALAIGTRGWLRPEVVVGLDFAGELSDPMLAGALAHELEHVRSLDPLRYLAVELALAVNPLGRFLLAPHAARWLVAREAECDREAVLGGAAPLPLAYAIVRAARPSPQLAVALGSPELAVIEYRVRMLLAFAERAPARHGAARPRLLPASLALLGLTLLLPHQTSSAALDVLHTGSERALVAFLP
ncbi:MAG: hypothetical protein OZ921_20365 [Sorangiineae bacterium]|nr:hypothetical protein [Polyangiaceae bacterium]MEB2324879.1 hypothetical protein [Sorangiineae bacterium]